MKRVVIGVVVVVVGLFAGVGVYGQVRRHHREAAAEQAAERLREQRLAATTPLQRAASAIDHARRAGDGSHFAVVPKTLPPGLLLMEPVGGPEDDGVTDVYSYGKLKAFLKYTAVPGKHPCGAQTCIRDSAVGVVTAEAPSLRHVSIWLTGGESSAGQKAEVTEFWTRTTWVPTAKAAWFTELAIAGDIP